MPKPSDMPRFRAHTRTGAKGKTWTSYFWDGRSIGQKDIPLGNDYTRAVELWRDHEEQRSAAMTAVKWNAKAADSKKTIEEAARLLRLLLVAHEARPIPGVYFLLDAAGLPLYVGQSENVLARMRGHEDKQFATVRMVPTHSADERMMLERQFVRFLAPVLNIHLVAALTT